MTVQLHWLVAATALMLGLVPLLWVVVRGSVESALVAVQQATTVTVLILVALAQAFERKWFNDLAITLAVLAFSGALVFTRFLGRYL